MKKAILSFFLFAMSSVFAASSIQSVKDFSGIAAVVAKIAHPTQTLVVLDDDDTLTMLPCQDQHDIQSCQYIGGPAWGTWQASLAPNNPWRVSPDQSGIYTDSALILSMSNSTYTDTQEASVLSQFGTEGVTTLIETARSPSNLNATEAQLSQLTVPGTTRQTLADFIKAHSVLMPSGLPSLAGSICGTEGERPDLYRNGVMYVTGQNKGQLLQCLLQKANDTKIKYIVFADDTAQNIQDVADAFKSSDRYTIWALDYTKLDAHKADLTISGSAKAYQLQAVKEWNRLKSALKQNIASPSAQ